MLEKALKSISGEGKSSLKRRPPLSKRKMDLTSIWVEPREIALVPVALLRTGLFGFNGNCDMQLFIMIKNFGGKC
jgi:hypothetical protein